MWAHEVMRAAQSQDTVAQVIGNVADLRMLTRREANKPGDDREDILDPVGEFVRDHLALFHHQFLFVDIGAGADPAGNDALAIADRQGAAQRPAIFAAMVAQAIFDLIGFAGDQAGAPAAPGAFLIVGMEDTAPPFAIGRARRRAGIFIPARIIIVMIAVGQRRPDHLRHGVGQRVEHAVAGGERGRAFILEGDDVAVAATPLQFDHHLPREQDHALALHRRQVGARLGVDDAQRAKRHTIGPDQRRASVEADMRRPGDQQIVGEAGILGRVGDDENVRPEHGVRAEGDVARGILRVQPGTRQETLTHILDNADQRDRRVAQRSCELRDLVQIAETTGVEIVEREQRGSIRLQAATLSHR